MTRRNYPSRRQSATPAALPRRADGSLHLRVSVGQEMVEALDMNEAEARIFHVGDDIEGNRQSAREEHLVHPAVSSVRSHAETGKERTSETKTKQRKIDDLRRADLTRARAQSCRFEQAVERR